MTKKAYTFPEVPVRFVPFESFTYPIADSPAFQQPYVYLYLLSCDVCVVPCARHLVIDHPQIRQDKNVYAQSVKDILARWVSNISSIGPQCSWMIINITQTDGKRVIFGNSVFDKIKADFNKNADRCFQLKAQESVPDPTAAELWALFLPRFLSEIFATFESRFVQWRFNGAVLLKSHTHAEFPWPRAFFAMNLRMDSFLPRLKTMSSDDISS